METTPLELGASTAYPTLLITQHGEEMNEFWNQTLQELGFELSHHSYTDWQSYPTPELVLLDATNQPAAALEICQELVKTHPSLPLVAILTRSDLAQNGADWHAKGAQNFLRLDATRTEITTVLENEIKIARLQKELAGLKQQLISNRQHDNITQFLTRRHFFFDAHRECSRARRYGHSLSCIMITIDYFDNFVKTFGVPCTTYLLRQLAQVIRQCSRESDIIARFSSNKIVALLPETDVNGAIMVRERILDAINQCLFTWNAEPLSVSVSIGEAERSHVFDAKWPDQEHFADVSIREEIARLLEDADNALSVARKSSKRPEMFINYSEVPLVETTT